MGILATIRVVRALIKRFRTKIRYCIIGLMIGSIYEVIIETVYLELPRPPMSFLNFSIVFFIIGCTIVLG